MRYSILISEVHAIFDSDIPAVQVVRIVPYLAVSAHDVCREHAGGVLGPGGFRRLPPKSLCVVCVVPP